MLRTPILLAPIHHKASYSIAIVRKFDYENYLCTLLLPKMAQSFAFALRAFNVELAQIRDRTKSLDQARFRFQFWRDVVTNVLDSNQSSTSPIEKELSQSISGLRLSKDQFYRLINARENYFNEHAFNSILDAETYAEETNIPIYLLLCEAYGIHSLAVNRILSHLSKAQGLVNLIRGSPILAKTRRTVTLPKDLTSKHKLDRDLLVRLLLCNHETKSPDDESFRRLIHDIAFVAREHASIVSETGQQLLADSANSYRKPFQSSKLRKIEEHQNQLILTLLPRLLLPLCPITSYLNRLSYQANFDPRHPILNRDGLLPVRLVWSGWRSRIPAPPKP